LNIYKFFGTTIYKTKRLCR